MGTSLIHDVRKGSLKIRGLLPALFVLAVIPSLSAGTIDLSKPVSESLKPDGIYWTFDEGTVGESFPLEVEDHSGNEYTGRLRDGKIRTWPVYDHGKFGLALRFPAFPEGFDHPMDSPNPSVLWQLKDTPGAWDETKLDLERKSFTGGLWIKFDEILLGEREVVYLLVRGRLAPRQWMFVLVKEPTDKWQLYFGNYRSAETQALDDQEWHHLAFTVDMRGDAGYVSFFLDGQPLGEPVPMQESLLAPEIDADRFLILGERNVGNFGTGFAGLMDDVFITSGVHSFIPPP